jgi:hypothetical protein
MGLRLDSFQLGALVLNRDWNRFGPLRELVVCVYDGITRHDTDHEVFHGSYDWHSSVHAHWCLLRLAVEFGDAELQHQLKGRLCSESMSKELAHVLATETFEMPYGRAWLLLVLREIESSFADYRFRAPGDEIAWSVWEWLNRGALSPDVGEYENPCWPLLQLLEWTDSTGNTKLGERLRALVRECFLSQGLTPDQDFGRPEFFSRWGLQALLIGRALGADSLASWVKDQSVAGASLAVVNDYGGIHHLGINASTLVNKFHLTPRSANERNKKLASPV